MKNQLITGLLVGALTLGGAASGNTYPRAGTTELLTAPRLEPRDCALDLDEVAAVPAVEGTGVHDAEISDNGRYIVFESRYCDLVEGDNNDAADIFMYDRKANQIEMLSTTPFGTAPAHDPLNSRRGSFTPTFSANGRFVAFASSALDLVPGAVTAGFSIYVRDLKTDTTELITRILNLPANASATDYFHPSLSADGRLVAFSGSALFLGLVDTTPSGDVMVHDRDTEKTWIVSVNSRGEQSKSLLVQADSTCPEITPDGTQVVFDSGAMDLVDDDTTVWRDVFVHDLQKKTTERVSLASGNQQADEGSLGTTGCHGGSKYSNDPVSGDGRTVVFTSGLRDFIPNDSNDQLPAMSGGDVFVHDRHTTRTDRVSINSFGEQHPLGGGGSASVSRDGRYVIFQGPADLENPPFVSDVTKRTGLAVFLYDRRTFSLERLDTPEGSQDCVPSSSPGDVSPTGRYVPFVSCSALSPEDVRRGNPKPEDDIDLYIRDRGMPLHSDAMARIGPSSPRIAGLSVFTSHRFASVSDPHDLADPSGIGSAEIIGLDLAHRPDLGDLFFRIELDRLVSVASTPGVSAMVGNPLLVYGISFTYEDRSFELRISQVGPTANFGLFECFDLGCTEVTKLRGGFGTIGHSVAVSLPLDSIGFDGSHAIENIEAFSAIGNYSSGVARILDRANVE